LDGGLNGFTKIFADSKGVVAKANLVSHFLQHINHSLKGRVEEALAFLAFLVEFSVFPRFLSIGAARSAWREGGAFEFILIT